jgi:hypothetical protein
MPAHVVESVFHEIGLQMLEQILVQRRAGGRHPYARQSQWRYPLPRIAAAFQLADRKVKVRPDFATRPKAK